MEERRQPVQLKEAATRPKEPRGRGRNPVQLENVVTSTVKRDSEKRGKYTSSEVENNCNRHSRGGKTPEKSPKVQKSKNNPADDTDGSKYLPTKSSRKPSLKDTSAKREKDKGSLSRSNDKIAQLTANVRYLSDELLNGTEKKPSKKLNKSGSLGKATNSRAEDQSSISKMIDKQQKLKHTKYKSSDDIHENGAKKASEKKVCGKIRKEEKMKISNLDNGDVTEPKERDGKTGNPRAPRGLKDIVDGKLRMKMEDISNAAEKVNKVVDTILKYEQFRKDSIFKDIKKMSTGSYYERVKISDPNEFDIMLGISLKCYNTIMLTNLDKKGPYYRLAFKDRTPGAMCEYLDSERNISATKILDQFRGLIKQITVKPGMKEVSLQRKDHGSPAVTLTIKNEPQDISVDLVLALKIAHKWPEETNNGMKIDDWLGTKEKKELKKNNFYMVSKQPKTGNKTMNLDTWRISFSNIEKKILTNHGNGKTCCETGGNTKQMCCRKQCLKLLKYLLELLKMNGKQRKMDQFFSYHAKTALLHHCAQHPKDEEWKLEDLETCFNRYVDFFQDCLWKRTLYNFFIPSHNLFSADFVDKSSCEYLLKVIEEQRREKYPIFYD